MVARTNANDMMFEREGRGVVISNDLSTGTVRADGFRNSTNLTIEVSNQYVMNDVLSLYNLRVESYQGLVILHGVVPARTAREAESVAAHTPGVDQVFSYLQTTEMATPVSDPTPALVELNHEPIRDRFESPTMFARYDQGEHRRCSKCGEVIQHKNSKCSHCD
jgi:hypothetical protein